MNYHPFRHISSKKNFFKKHKLIIFEIIFKNEYDVIKCVKMMKCGVWNLAPIIISEPFSSLTILKIMDKLYSFVLWWLMSG